MIFLVCSKIFDIEMFKIPLTINGFCIMFLVQDKFITNIFLLSSTGPPRGQEADVVCKSLVSLTFWKASFLASFCPRKSQNYQRKLSYSSISDSSVISNLQADCFIYTQYRNKTGYQYIKYILIQI